jgi:NAD(P)-dependent dehydrogenase (short-subunit alcohol dehydrogenase family)
MRILIVGSTGLLGTALVKALGKGGLGHDVVQASRRGQTKVDITDPGSIEDMYRSIGAVDAVACAAGSAHQSALEALAFFDMTSSVGNKMLGQMELVRRGLQHVSDGGSFTLVSGVTAYDPIKGGALLSAVNAGVDGFVRGAAIDMPRGIRINSVSATIFSEAHAKDRVSFPGFVPVPTAAVALAFVKSIEGRQTGQMYRVGY